MRRFLLLALTSLLLLFATFHLAVEMAGFEPDLGPLVGWQPGARGLPGGWILATWALEALTLTALFLLVDARGGSRLFDGLMAAWCAWVFRGPVLVMTVVGFGGQPLGPWWRLTLRWFVLYTLAGLLLALVARVSELRRPVRGRVAAAAPGAGAVGDRPPPAVPDAPRPAAGPVEPRPATERVEPPPAAEPAGAPRPAAERRPAPPPPAAGPADER